MQYFDKNIQYNNIKYLYETGVYTVENVIQYVQKGIGKIALQSRRYRRFVCSHVSFALSAHVRDNTVPPLRGAYRTPAFFCGKHPRAFYRLSYSQPVQRGGDLRYSDRFGGNASRRNLHLSCGQGDKKQDLKIFCRNNFPRGFQRFCRASYFRPCGNERICLHARSCDNRRRRTRRGCGFRRNFIFCFGKNFHRKG